MQLLVLLLLYSSKEFDGSDGAGLWKLDGMGTMVWAGAAHCTLQPLSAAAHCVCPDCQPACWHAGRLVPTMLRWVVRLCFIRPFPELRMHASNKYNLYQKLRDSFFSTLLQTALVKRQ
jgi:hypothetical protein